MKKLLATFALLAATAAFPALSQQARPAPAAPAQPVLRSQSVDPNSLVNAALQVAGLVDAGRAAEVWDGASGAAKAAVQRQAFIDGVAAMRSKRVLSGVRAWQSVRRVQVAQGENAPAGSYVSVELVAQAKDGTWARELVTFRADDDGVLRFSGYVTE